MKHTAKTGEFLRMHEMLQQVLSHTSSVVGAYRVNFRLGSGLGAIGAALKPHFEDMKRIGEQLGERHAPTDGEERGSLKIKDNMIEFSPSNAPKVQELIAELLERPLTVDLPKKTTLKELEASDLPISGVQLFILRPFFDVPEEA